MFRVLLRRTCLSDSSVRMRACCALSASTARAESSSQYAMKKGTGLRSNSERTSGGCSDLRAGSANCLAWGVNWAEIGAGRIF